MQCETCTKIKSGELAVDEHTNPVCALRPCRHEIDEKGRTLNAVWESGKAPSPEENAVMGEFLAGEAAARKAEETNGNAA